LLHKSGKQPTSPNETWKFTELTVMCAVADRQLHSYISICRNFSLKVETLVLKWVIMKVRKIRK